MHFERWPARRRRRVAGSFCSNATRWRGSFCYVTSVTLGTIPFHEWAPGLTKFIFYLNSRSLMIGCINFPLPLTSQSFNIYCAVNLGSRTLGKFFWRPCNLESLWIDFRTSAVAKFMTFAIRQMFLWRPLPLIIMSFYLPPIQYKNGKIEENIHPLSASKLQEL